LGETTPIVIKEGKKSVTPFGTTISIALLSMLAAIAVQPVAAPLQGSPKPIAAARASDFLNSIGANSAVSTRGERLADTVKAVRYLGLRWIRSGYEGNLPVEDLIELHRQTGIRFSYGLASGGTDLPRLLEGARRLASAGALLALEGNNEPNNWGITYQGERGGRDLSWIPVAKLQRDLYRAVKSDPVLRKYPVWSISESGAETDNVGLQFLTIPAGASTIMPAGTHYADFANCHNYMIHPSWPGLHNNQTWIAADPTSACKVDGLYGNYGRTWLKKYPGYSEAQLLTLPRVTTETGVTIEGPFTEHVQALLYLSVYLAQFKRGWSHTSIYILRDRSDEAGNQSFGFYTKDYVPREAARYLHNLTTILADSGSRRVPQALAYAIPNQPDTVHDLLLQKSDGTFELVLWGERFTGGSDEVTLQLARRVPQVRVFDPTVGTEPVRIARNLNSFTFTVNDHPVIVELRTEAVRRARTPMPTSTSTPTRTATVASAGTTYYVATNGSDANPGTSARPWRTIQKAASTVTAGSTVRVRSGTYNEVVTPAHSGKAGAPITYMADAGAKVYLDGTGKPGGYGFGIWNIAAKSHIIVKGFHFIHGYGNGITLQRTDHIRILNNTFNSDFGWNPIEVDSTANTSSSNIEIAGNYIHRTFIPGSNSNKYYTWYTGYGPPYNTPGPWSEMISMSKGSHFSVHDNVIDLNQLGEGINMKNGMHDSKAFRNRVSNTTSVAMYIGGWDEGNYNIEYYDNVINNPGHNGLVVSNEKGPTATHDIKIYNNVIMNTGNAPGLGIGFYGSGTFKNVTAVNNTLYNSAVAVNPGWLDAPDYYMPPRPTFSNVVLRNNIFSGGVMNVRLTGVSADHNGFFNATPFGTDAVVDDPLFVNPAKGDFHLQKGSPMIDQGSATGTPKTDFDGVKRPQGAGFDLGAYELPLGHHAWEKQRPLSLKKGRKA